MVRRGKGRGQKTSTISVVEAMPEENEYLIEGGEAATLIQQNYMKF